MLAAVDDPAAVDFIRAGNHGGIVRAARRLGERERGAFRAVHQPRQIVAVLFRRTMTCDRDRRQPAAAAGEQTKNAMRTAEFFQHQTIRKQAHARAAHILRQAHRQVAVLAQQRQHVRRQFAGFVDAIFQRRKFGCDEFAQCFAHLREFG